VRVSLVILTLAAVTVATVHLRRAETRARHQVYRLQIEQIHLRRRLYDQQAILGRLTAPRRVRQRVRQLDVRLTSRLEAPQALAREQVRDGR
jgi:hypothetical protein